MLARQGIALDRSTLSHWVGTACWWLAPLYDLIVGTVLAAPKVFADDTALPALDPGRGRTKTGRLWCHAVDDRPWCGPSHPAVAYLYAEDRKAIRPAAHLAGFDGVLQVDGHAGFKRLAGERTDSSVRLAFCWVHMRRSFYQFHASTKAPIAGELLARVASLYEIAAEIRGSPAGHRRAIRQARSRPIVAALHTWLQEQEPRLPGGSDLAKAMRHALRHWPGLIAFLDDGGIEMDTNVVERAIRPVALNRKNALFAGSDGGARHWAIAMTLIATAKLNGVEPMAWLAFASSPAAPKHVMSALERDGYLTGVLVTPSLIPPSQWMAGLWGEEEPGCDDAAQIQSVLGAVDGRSNARSGRIEQSLRRLQAETVCDYRPAFQPEAGKPFRDDITTWLRGFRKPMSLAPADWAALIEDHRTQVIVTPFVGFMDRIKDDTFEPAPDIDERLDEVATEIPRAILLLRKIAEPRASPTSRPTPLRSTKVGRNGPCPCGSGKKFKRCCGIA
jgi:yecA family protein